jgi:hypothetical protein
MSVIYDDCVAMLEYSTFFGWEKCDSYFYRAVPGSTRLVHAWWSFDEKNGVCYFKDNCKFYTPRVVCSADDLVEKIRVVSLLVFSAQLCPANALTCMVRASPLCVVKFDGRSFSVNLFDSVTKIDVTCADEEFTVRRVTEVEDSEEEVEIRSFIFDLASVLHTVSEFRDKLISMPAKLRLVTNRSLLDDLDLICNDFFYLHFRRNYDHFISTNPYICVAPSVEDCMFRVYYQRDDGEHMVLKPIDEVFAFVETIYAEYARKCLPDFSSAFNSAWHALQDIASIYIVDKHTFGFNGGNNFQAVIRYNEQRALYSCSIACGSDMTVLHCYNAWVIRDEILQLVAELC